MRDGWQSKTLAEVCEVFTDGDWVESKDQSPQGIRLIQTGNIGEGAFKDRREKARHVSEDTFMRLRCTEIFAGDCLISRLPEPVGRSCLLPHADERMITAVDCTIARFNADLMIAAFFNFLAQSVDYLNAVDAQTTGTTRKRISRSRLGRATIPVPPLPEQKRIVDILDEAFEGTAAAKANAEKNLHRAPAPSSKANWSPSSPSVAMGGWRGVWVQSRRSRAAEPHSSLAKRAGVVRSLGIRLESSTIRTQQNPKEPSQKRV